MRRVGDIYKKGQNQTGASRYGRLDLGLQLVHRFTDKLICVPSMPVRKFVIFNYDQVMSSQN